jgi:hypothetical protein
MRLRSHCPVRGGPNLRTFDGEALIALRCWDSRAKLSSMNRKELEERVDEILLKRTRGEKLTRQEEKILAYTYHAASQRRTIVRMRPRRKT